MKKRSLLFSALMLAGVTNVHALPYGFSDARSVAMGNVSVATGGVTTAAFSNPAMLMVNETDDTFALHIGVGAVFIEDGGITDDIDEFQTIEDQIDSIVQNDPSNTTALLNALNAQRTIIGDLNGDSLIGRGTPNVALVYGGDSFTVAVTAGGEAYASGAIDNVTGTTGTILESDIQDDLNDNGILDDSLNVGYIPSADLKAVGVITQEVGVSIASNVTLLGMDVSFGIKPKVVSAEAITYRQAIDIVDVEDIIDDSTQDLGSFTTLDAGVAIGVTDSIRVGMVAKNLISETLTVNTNGFNKDIDFDTQLRVGVSYNTSFMTVAADMDLIETDPILVEDANRMLALGVELNAFDFVQLRAGYQKNMASGASSDDLISAGVGLWLGFNLDIAAVVSEDSVGAFVQTGFHF